MNQTNPEKNQHIEGPYQEQSNFAKCIKLDLKMVNRKPISQIYHGKHQQKREGPPGKKEQNKEGTIEHKIPPRKQENSLKNEDNTKNNVPLIKHKHLEKDKQINIEPLPNEYHLVSHSQRDKIFMGSIGAHMANQGALRDSHLGQKIKIDSGYDALHLAQVNQNLQNMKDSQNYAYRLSPPENQTSPQQYNEALVNIAPQKKQ